MAYGTLEVVLVEAKDLYNTATFFTNMDPYVILTVKTQEKISTVAQDQGRNPEWNESFLFTITDDVTELHLKIMDKDTFSSDDFVGEVTITLDPELFYEGSIPAKEYNVVSKHQKFRGQIKLGMNFTPDPSCY